MEDDLNLFDNGRKPHCSCVKIMQLDTTHQLSSLSYSHVALDYMMLNPKISFQDFNKSEYSKQKSISKCSVVMMFAHVKHLKKFNGLFCDNIFTFPRILSNWKWMSIFIFYQESKMAQNYLKQY